MPRGCDIERRDGTQDGVSGVAVEFLNGSRLPKGQAHVAIGTILRFLNADEQKM
jgi:hypothetical protein